VSTFDSHRRLRRPGRAVGWALATVAVLLGGAGMGACTDAKLEIIPPPGPFRDDKVTVQGEICTTSPESRVFPLRVLFVIDSSESMRVTDPPDPVSLVTGRERAFQETWETLLDGDPAGVRIGLVQFSADAQGRTISPFNAERDTYYTANRTLLADATAGLQVTGRTTNYLGALNEAFVAVRSELENARDFSPESLALSKYVVIFVSDGLPDVDNEEEAETIEEQILQAVGDIRELGEDLFRVGTFEFHTAYVSAGEGPAVDRDAQRLLQLMAETGGGTFRSFPSGESLNFVFLDLTVIRRAFTLRGISVTNVNAIVDEDQIAEYLFAEDEDPFAFDAGVDAGPPDPMATPDAGVDAGPDAGAPDAGPMVDERNLVDRDGNEVPSCGEPLVDSDGDGLWDLIERRFDTEGLDERMTYPWLTEDTDDDGVRDRLEWRLQSSGLDPLTPGDTGCFVPEPCLERDPDTGACQCVIDLRTLVADPTQPDGFDRVFDGDGICDACDEVASEDEAFFCFEIPDPVTGGTLLVDCADRELDPETGEMVGDGFCDCLDRDEDGYCDWLDRDGDLLRDCEEIFYGTNQNSNDSDADGIPDFLETRYESNPIENDLLDDSDFDQTVNSLEVRSGTDPWCDDASIRSLISYQYDQTNEGFDFPLLDGGLPTEFIPIDAGPMSMPDGSTVDAGGGLVEIDAGPDGDDAIGSGLRNARSCYRFQVGNVTIVPTAPNWRAVYPGNGWNRILVWVGEVPFDDPDAVAFYRIACTMAFYDPDGNLRNPPSGRLRFQEADFVEASEFDADVHCKWP